MPKTKRWQPPHPAKDTRPKNPPPRKAAAHMDQFQDPNGCHWVNCNKQSNKHHGDTRLCWEHLEPLMDLFMDNARNDITYLQMAHLRYRELVVIQEEQVASGASKTINPNLANGHVYLVQIGDLIKIGFSTQPWVRLRSYPPNATVHVVYPGTKATEKALHSKFTFALAKGREWFHDRPEIQQHIAEMLDIYGEPDKEYTDRYRDARHTSDIVGAKNWTGHKRALVR